MVRIWGMEGFTQRMNLKHSTYHPLLEFTSVQSDLSPQDNDTPLCQTLPIICSYVFLVSETMFVSKIYRKTPNNWCHTPPWGFLRFPMISLCFPWFSYDFPVFFPWFWQNVPMLLVKSAFLYAFPMENSCSQTVFCASRLSIQTPKSTFKSRRPVTSGSEISEKLVHQLPLMYDIWL